LKFIQDLKPLRLYSKKRKIFIPFDPKDKRKGAAILLLTPSLQSSVKLMQLSYFYNPNYFTAYYADRNVNSYIKSDEIVDTYDETEDSEAVEESVRFKSTVDVNYNGDTSDCSGYLKQTVMKLSPEFKEYLDINYTETINFHISSSIMDLKNLVKKACNDNLSKGALSYSRPYNICILDYNAYSKESGINDPTAYQLYIDSEAMLMCMLIKNPRADIHMCSVISAVLVGAFNYYESKKLLDGEFSLQCKIVKAIIEENPSFAKRKIRSMILTNNFNYIEKYRLAHSEFIIDNIMGKFVKESAEENEEENVRLPGNYDEVLKICKSLSPEEFAYISFTPVYQNSPNVIHRHIEWLADKPAGFLDVYQFKTKPGVVYLTIAVNPFYRRQGIADKMLKTVLKSNLPEKYKFHTWIWDANVDNIASQKVAEKNGFKRDADLDVYGRYQYRLYLNPKTKVPLPDGYVVIENGQEDYKIANEYASIQSSGISMISFFNESNLTSFNEAEKKYDARLRRYLFKERIKQNKQVLTINNDIKNMVPFIRRTFLNLEKYNRFNLFYDLYYYNALFLKNNILRLDKGVNMYLDFISRLINNSELSSIYKHQTIFIPADAEDWGVPKGADITDFRSYLNPISIIVRLLRKNPDALKYVFGGKHIVFVAKEGYFFIDFNNFSMKHLSKLKRALKKLSSGEEIVEGEDIEPEDSDFSDYQTDDENSDSPAAMTVAVIDKIENKLGIEISDVSSAVSATSKRQKINTDKLDIEHLKIKHINATIPNISNTADNGTAVILMSPNMSASASISSNAPFTNADKIDAYLINK